MKNTQKKYPLLVSLIVSCVIVVASIFVLAFCGMRLSPSLGGGSQIEIAISDGADAKTCVQDIKKVLKEENIQYDSFIIEDSSTAGDDATELSQRKIVVNLQATDVSDEKELKIRQAISEKLSVAIESISEIDNMISSIRANDILLFGLGIGIIAVCIFVFGFVRYDIFAGISFLLAIVHNLILFLSLIILTRIPLGLVSLAIISILTLVSLACLVSVYEKNKLENEMHLAEKETPSSRLMRVEFMTLKSYIFIPCAIVIFSILMLIVPVYNVALSAISVLVALLVTMYTTTLVAPGVYASLLDLQKATFEATLSRNDTVNKVIKKKIAKAKKTTSK